MAGWEGQSRVDSSPESHRKYLDRVRGALEKVRRVLGDLDPHTPGSARALDRTAAAPAETSPGVDRDDLLRAHEVARHLDIPVKDVYAAVRDRRLRATRIGRFLWFRREDVEALHMRTTPGALRRRTR